MDGLDEEGNQRSREYMTFNWFSNLLNDISQYPYVKKLTVPGKNTKNTPVFTDFIYQFVKNCSLSCQYGDIEKSNTNIANIIGPPRDHRNDEKMSFLIYDTSHVQDETNSVSFVLSEFDMIMRSEKKKIYRYHINLEYHEAVYPLKISTFSDYSISISQIWAKDSDDNWSLLWDADYTYNETGMTDIAFRSILWPRYFKTKMLKLQFKCYHLKELEHLKHLTAVMLIGTTDLILPRKLKQKVQPFLIDLLDKINPCICHPMQTFEFPIYITALQCICQRCQRRRFPRCYIPENKNTRWNVWHHYVICESKIVESFHKSALGHKYVCQEITHDYGEYFTQMYKYCISYGNNLNYERFLEDIKLLWEKSNKSHYCFSELPDDILIKILKNLDLKSLRHISRVNKRLNFLSRDSQLYKSLNLRNILYTHWRCDPGNILLHFTPRCKYLTELDLSFCEVSVTIFNKFLATCGKFLTDLRLSNCLFINDSALFQISRTCKNLKGLDLNGCYLIKDVGFSYLENIKFLERLHFEHVRVGEVETLCKVLQRNQQMRDLNLARTFRSSLRVNEVAINLETLCANLEKINLALTNLTSRGINALANCKNLREVNFRRMTMKYPNYENDRNDLKNSFHRLFSSCQRLEKIDLSFTRIFVNHELQTLTLCKNLKCLKLMDVSYATRDVCEDIFLACPKLEVIYVSPRLAKSLTNYTVYMEEYQHITVFSSLQ